MIGGLILAGCQVDLRPQDAGNFSTNRAATKGTAEYAGTYVLYDDNNPGRAEAVLMTVHLKTGDVVGFEVDNNQVPYAIAGQQRMQLAVGRYRWEMTPDAGQVDWNKTTVIVVEVTLGVAVVVLAVIGTLAAVRAI